MFQLDCRTVGRRCWFPLRKWPPRRSASATGSEPNRASRPISTLVAPGLAGPKPASLWHRCADPAGDVTAAGGSPLWCRSTASADRLASAIPVGRSRWSGRQHAASRSSLHARCTRPSNPRATRLSVRPAPPVPKHRLRSPSASCTDLATTVASRSPRCGPKPAARSPLGGRTLGRRPVVHHATPLPKQVRGAVVVPCANRPTPIVRQTVHRGPKPSAARPPYGRPNRWARPRAPHAPTPEPKLRGGPVRRSRERSIDLDD